MLDKKNNSSYTVAVDATVKSITGQAKFQNSLYQQAAEFFKTAPVYALKVTNLERQIAELQQEIDNTPLFKFKPKAKLSTLAKLNKQLAEQHILQEKQRIARLNNAIDVCLKLLFLTEGEDHQETQLKSAKFLTTMQLFSPGEGKALAELHQRLKPAYKAILSLRLLDKLINDGNVKNKHILAHYHAVNRYSNTEMPNEIGYTQSVLLPIMFAALFQDVGWQHPEVATILDGEKGEKDRFRLLTKVEKSQVAKLNYQYTLEYLEQGLGYQPGQVTLAEDAKLFKQAESQRISFQAALIKDAGAIKFGISEIIKVPQIYASIVFSTHREFSKTSLPNASLLISQLANNQKISNQVAESFISIVGRFPLGYGVVYIPLNNQGAELKCYEYAIVTGLNPANIDEPNCRLVSRNLMFSDYSKNGVIPRNRNTHFETARKKLDSVDPTRLLKLRQIITHKFDPKKAEELIPAYWQAYNYFFVEGYQNLWNQVGQEQSI